MPETTRVERGTLPLLFLIATVIVVGLNFRAPLLAVSPLLEVITDATGISSTVAGLLTTIPVVCFGLVSPAAPALARRFGMEWLLFGIFVVLISGILLRAAPSVHALFAGTVVIGAAIAIGNVIVPGFVKREAPHRIGQMTALYSASLSASGALGSGLTIPLMDSLDLSWRGALTLTAISSCLGLLILVPWLLHSRGTPLGGGRRHASTGLWRNRLAWYVTIYMGSQSLLFFAVAAWLPTLLIANGMPEARAGFMLSISPLFGTAGSFIGPLLTGRRRDQRWLIWLSSALCAFGLTGLLLAPVTLTALWVTVFGFGSGMTLSLALTFIGLRSPDSRHAADLSGMSQSVGYTLAALGPLLMGFIHDLTGGWTVPMAVVLATTVVLLLSGLAAARDRLVAPMPTEPVAA
jgi:CP family cyanate transporter-like MFS transporter